MTRRCRFDDLKFLPGVYGLSISERYDGASPWSEMKVKISYLYLIRDSTGNQRRDFKTGVMCSYFLVLLTTRTAAFCNLWSLDNWYQCIIYFCWYAGMPYRSALPWSSRDLIKACTRHSTESAVRYFLIMPMFLWWKWPALHIELIWASIFMCSSNMMPKLRACLTEWMILLPIVAEGGAVMVWLSFLVMYINSVLPSLSFSILTFIHALISAAYVSMWAIEVSTTSISKNI